MNNNNYWSPQQLNEINNLRFVEKISNSLQNQPIIYPYPDALGQVNFFILRWDFIDKDGNNQKEIRPLFKEQQQNWSMKRPYDLVVPYNLPEIITRKTDPILVVEGEKTAEAAKLLFSHWVVTTSAFGANAADKTDWSYLKDRDIVISPDHDEAGIKYAETVSSLCYQAGAKSVKLLPIEKLTVKFLNINSQQLKKGYDLANTVQDGVTAEQITQENIENLLESLPTKVTSPKHLELGSSVELANVIIASLDNCYGKVIYAEGSLWRYKETQWHKIEPVEIICDFINCYDGATYGKFNRIIKIGESKTKDIYNSMIPILSYRMENRNKANFFTKAPIGINCMSGFITFNKDGTPQLSPHSPEHRQRHTLKGKWQPNLNWKKPDSLLLKLLNGTFPNDQEKQRLLQEIAGATISRCVTKLKQPKAIVLHGEKAANGKSQILNLLRSLVPPDAVCSIPPAKMSDERYVTEIKGKLLNTSDELSLGGAINSDVFKAIITGEPITGRGVFKDPVTFQSEALNVFATNLLPSFKGGMDKSTERRILLLPCDRTIPFAERVENIGARIGAEEGDLLLSWAIAGAERIIRQVQFSCPQFSEDALMEWAISSDSVRAWVDACIEIVPITKDKNIPYTDTSHAHAKYKDWAENNGFSKEQIFSINNFVQKVKNIDGIGYKRTNKKRVFLGIAFSPQTKPEFNQDNVVYLNQQ